MSLARDFDPAPPPRRFAAVRRVPSSGFGRPAVVAARQRLSFEGPAGRRAFLINEGWAFTYRMLPDGARQIVQIAVAGDMLGLPQLFWPGSATDGAATVTASVIQELPADSLPVLLRSAPDAALSLWRLGVEAFQFLPDRLVDVGRRTAAQRVARLLLELKARLGRVGLATGTTFRCPLTQQLIADAVGLTSIHVNRTLRQLRSAGLMVASGGVVEIPDERRLARFVAWSLDEDPPALAQEPGMPLAMPITWPGGEQMAVARA